MEEPENNPVTDTKKDDTLINSVSSEDSDSWTLLGKNNGQVNKEPSGVQIITAADGIESDDLPKSRRERRRKRRHDSHKSTGSLLDESSDGISVISESDAITCEKQQMDDEVQDESEATVHFRQKIELNLPDYQPPTPPFTPDDIKPAVTQQYDNKHGTLLERPMDNAVETIDSVVEHRNPSPVPRANWILFGVLATGMIAVIVGNSHRLQNQAGNINFEHENRISELELENNILKMEMKKLRHLYTRPELDEQVQQAEFETRNAFLHEAVTEVMNEADTIPDADPESNGKPHQSMRKVPPQDAGVERKVVWSGDEEEPMLIVDKDYVIPAFCYNQDQAVQNDLFSEYSAKYCNIKKRKTEAKQKQAEFRQKHETKKTNYNKYIIPKGTERPNEAPVGAGKPASPFNIDYKKAFDAIKAEGSVIVEALGSILDLSPEPAEVLNENVMNSENIETNEEIAEIIAPAKSEHRAEYSEVRPEDKPPIRKHENGEERSYGREQEKRCQDHSCDERKRDKHHSSKENKWSDKDNRSDREGSYKQKHNGDRKENRSSESNGKKRNENYDAHKTAHRDHDHPERKEYRDSQVRDRSHREYDDDHRKKYDKQPEYSSPKKHHHSSHDGDDDDDNYYKKKFSQHENSKDRSQDKRKRNSGESRTGSSEEYSYLEHYRRENEGKDGNFHDAQHHEYEKHHKKFRNQQKNGDKYHQKRSSSEQHWKDSRREERYEDKENYRKKTEHGRH